jgi:hypothetical protein
LSIGSLDDESARELVRQIHLPETARPGFGDEETERICRLCGNHPYQIQLLCRRALDRGNLDKAVEEVAHDRAVSFFFSVDYELLGEVERSILELLANQPLASLTEIQGHLDDAPDIAASLSSLHELGLVARGNEGRYEIASDFMRRWLVEGSAAPSSSA